MRTRRAAYLLDAHVLIALTIAEHEHHGRASAWFGAAPVCATCPTVEGALLRFLLRLGERPEVARAVLAGVSDHPRVRFWPDEPSYLHVDLPGVQGHRQLKDRYLAHLAATHGARLATLDARLVAELPEQAELIP